MKKLNPKFVGVIVVIAVILCFIGFKSTSSAEDKKMIKGAEAEMESGSFDGAESVVERASGGKAEKLHKALKIYNSATTNFFNNYGIPVHNNVIESGYNSGFEDTYNAIKEIPSDYKKYSAFKSEVNEWKDMLKTAIDMEKDLRKDYKDMMKMVDDKKYDECSEKAEKLNAKIHKEFPVKDSGGATTKEIFAERLEVYTSEFSEAALMSHPDYSDYSDSDSSEGSVQEPIEYLDGTTISPTI